MKENERKYDAIDFARYHSGTMPADEMHALEKAALEDPFLADALEGYAFSKDPGKELDEIKMRLEEKRNHKKVFTIYSLSSGAWWKIAAMFILFAGAGYFFYFTGSKKEDSLALKKDIPKNDNPVTTSPGIVDTSVSKSNISFEKTTVEKHTYDQAKLPAPVVKSTQPIVNKSAQQEEAMKQEKILSMKSLAAKKQNEVVMNSEKINSTHITPSESKEKSFYRSADTTASVVAPNIYAADSSNSVATNKQNATLNEVVVAGYGTQKKKDLTGTTPQVLQGSVSGVEATTTSPYPKNGKEKFDKYIEDNAIPVLDSTGKRIAADILLSFTLDKKSKPNHIKVVESSCKVCEKEAIRLLQDGPAWEGKQGEKGTARIQF